MSTKNPTSPLRPNSITVNAIKRIQDLCTDINGKTPHCIAFENMLKMKSYTYEIIAQSKNIDYSVYVNDKIRHECMLLNNMHGSEISIH